jgi:sulfate transport system ATP-binding protein
VEILPEAAGSALPARVARLQRVGFDVRADVTTAAGESAWVQLTRAYADALGLAEGADVWLRTRA